mmetsp:Transcript_29580/g.104231  ORF Transcript_29580/g.104231 Transcript_29580/m.104231 type:complete len:107 (+) Transcript_29580:62-382(+)
MPVLGIRHGSGGSSGVNREPRVTEGAGRSIAKTARRRGRIVVRASVAASLNELALFEGAGEALDGFFDAGAVADDIFVGAHDFFEARVADDEECLQEALVHFCDER